MLSGFAGGAYGLIKTMAKPTDTFKHRHEYIPPSVQKSLTDHMQTTMPGNLRKYQEPGHPMTQHAERALANHMEKTLPGHLKQYGSAYVQQNVVQPNLSRTTQTQSSASHTTANSPIPGGPRQNQHFSPKSGGSDSASSPNPSNPDSQYDFIFNPEQPSRVSLLTLPGNKFQKGLIIGGGIIVLIMLFAVASSFLSSSANAHTDKLVTLAKTQNEIIRIIDEADERVTDQNLRNLSLNTRLSVVSTNNQTISSLTARGKKLKDKELKVADPDNDKVLSEGEQNSRFDETYRALLEQELSEYRQQLAAVYESGNASEKEFTSSANEQINLILNTKNTNQ